MILLRDQVCGITLNSRRARHPELRLLYLQKSMHSPVITDESSRLVFCFLPRLRTCDSEEAAEAAYSRKASYSRTADVERARVASSLFLAWHCGSP